MVVTSPEQAIKELNGGTLPAQTAADEQPEPAEDEPTAEETPAATEADTPTEAEQHEKRLAWLEAWERRLVEQNGAVRDCESQVADAAEDLKARKKELEREQAILSAIIDESKQPTLFNQPADATPEPEAEPVAVEDESWRDVTLAELGIVKPKVVESLTAAKLDTLGKLADWTATSGGDFTMLDGIGGAGRILIEDACAKYWQEHPRQEAAEEPEAVDADTGEVLVEEPAAA